MPPTPSPPPLGQPALEQYPHLRAAARRLAQHPVEAVGDALEPTVLAIPAASSSVGSAADDAPEPSMELAISAALGHLLANAV